MISCDEKTGIQALERTAPNLPRKQGQIEKREFNYTRHGTVVLIANLRIADGKLINSTIGDSRTEADFLKHIQETVATDEQGKWIFIVDNLNTHQSATLTQWVAHQIGDEQDLGKKGKRGILQNMETRKEYLKDKKHRIRFVYTPKHCSWLNLVECFFATLSKRVIARGNFCSKEDLKNKLKQYLDYHNLHFAKQFKWGVKKKKDIKELIEKVKRMVSKFAP